MKDTVTMQSPSGEIREVEATETALVPLMVAGWNQIFPGEAQTQEEGK